MSETPNRDSAAPPGSLLSSIVEPVIDWYSGDGCDTDAETALRMAIEDLQSDRSYLLRLRAAAMKLVEAIEGVQDWSDTLIGERLESINEIIHED